MHPSYSPTTVWGFDGQVPGPLIRAKYGEPVLVRFQNSLPSVKVPQAFGIAEMTTHLHNGHTPVRERRQPGRLLQLDQRRRPARVTRSPQKLPVNPHGFKDQHYPNVYAGYISAQQHIGDPAEALGSLWYHDHHLDFTAQNVYKGMFGCYNLFDDVYDTGDGPPACACRSGDYDIPIFFNDFLFDQNYQTGVRPVRPRRHSRRPVLRQRRHPALS